MKYEATYKSPDSLHTLSLEKLLTLWENTEHLHTPELPIIRGWLMDELERRNPEGFSAWLDQDAPEDRDLRRFLSVNRFCLNCVKFATQCSGTAQQVWTGCIYRAVRASK